MKFKKFLTANKISSFMYTKCCKLDLGERMFLVCIYVTNFHMWFMCEASTEGAAETIFDTQHV